MSAVENVSLANADISRPTSAFFSNGVGGSAGLSADEDRKGAANMAPVLVA